MGEQVIHLRAGRLEWPGPVIATYCCWDLISWIETTLDLKAVTCRECLEQYERLRLGRSA